MTPYTYLLINFLTIIICFIFSFHPKIRFDRHFAAFIKAAALVATPFLLWDVWFTNMGVWWFDYRYTIGSTLLGLPVEEWLFFVCIPFSCVFTYHCLDKFFDLKWAEKFSTHIAWFSIAVCIMVVLFFHDRIYTTLTAMMTAAALVYLQLITKARWIGKASFVYLILMLGFIPVNGVLTGTGLESPIVNYNAKEILNIRILSIPIEDSVYGYTLFLLNVYLFKLFQKTPSDET
ncbi:lycopene cyclase domain-containing protein [Parapedobacter pyrenivorans]|uniref:lycopene cyclase domain-containing protein n=1 Tax=Parapedobacter pyrenivorans TaxID=1305674 RepID=UPI003340A538